MEGVVAEMFTVGCAYVCVRAYVCMCMCLYPEEQKFKVF